MTDQPSTSAGHIDTGRMQTNQPDADALVLFGATGDLAVRKLFPALYRLERSGVLKVPVIGVARSDWTDDGFRQHAACRPRVQDLAAARIRFSIRESKRPCYAEPRRAAVRASFHCNA